jgi:hypothetical protein
MSGEYLRAALDQLTDRTIISFHTVPKRIISHASFRSGEDRVEKRQQGSEKNSGIIFFSIFITLQFMN